MTYFVNIENGIINGISEVNNSRFWTDNYFQIEVDEEIYSNIEKYTWNGMELILDPEYEEKEAQKEHERIAMLSLTRGDVFRGLLQAKQITRSQIRTMIETNESLTELEREMALIDFDEALNFYRGNPLIDLLGLALGILPEQLDKFFETKDYTHLLPIEEPEEEIVEESEVVE